jgi:hypothetical protein
MASWALGGFYFSLMPSLVRVATGVTLPVVGGLVVSALTFSGADGRAVASQHLGAAHPVRRHPGARRRRGDHACGCQMQQVSLMLIGTIVAASASARPSPARCEP